MRETFEEQLRQTFDSLAEGLRVTVAHRPSVAAEQLAETVESDRQTASMQAPREAAAAAERDVAARLNAAFAVREAHIREAVHVDSFDAGLQQARAEDEAREQAREAEAQAREEARLEAAEQEAAEHSAALAAAQAAVDAARAIAATAQAPADAAHAAADEAKKAADSRIDRAAVEQMLGAVRSLDDATSLSQALDALSAAARAEADRMAIFLLRGDTLRVWSHVGFEAIGSDPVSDVPLAQGGAAAAAVVSGLAQRVPASGDGRPAFAGGPNTGTFVAVPLAMNSQVIGVLCGEQLLTSDAGQWLATTFEILARHASRVLESRTALRLAQRGSHPVATAAVSPPRPT